MTKIPSYILFLFAIVSIVLSYIVLTWIWGNVIKIQSINMVEGYTNPQYKYMPSNSSPNLSIQFGLADLAVDISSACGFIKVDSKLIKQAPTSTTPSQTTSPSTSGNPSSTPASTQPPIPTSAATPSANSNNDYTVPYTQLQIYKMYNSATGYSSTSNLNIYKMMDASYGSLFDSSNILNMTDANIEKLWNTNKSVIIDDTLYNGSKFFVIESNQSNRQCGKGLLSYFLQQVQKNKANPTILLSLKNAYYGIVKPRFLVNTLSNVYWQNEQSLTNSDKGTSNSVVFVLNTFAGLASTNTLSADLSANEVAQVISPDTPFTMDSLWLYQMVSISFELYRFCSNFQSNGTPAITTTAGTFISGYQKYLQKINQNAPQSPLLFLLQNLPNNSECAVVNTLSTYANNISN